MMGLRYPNLFSPIRVGSLLLKNRIIAAPTSVQNLSPEGLLTQDNIAYYELKAKGGCAVVTLGESIVETATGKSHDRQILMQNPDVLANLAAVVKAITRHGAYANIELSHGGKYAGLASIGGENVEENSRAYGPSDEITPSGDHVYAMPEEMIYRIIEAWGDAAAMAKRAGFSMVMVHAAHGWLFNQFLSPASNRRKDDFGGSLENRVRFLSLSLDNIRKKTGPSSPIQLRMNGEDFIEGGIHLEEYKQIAMMLEDKVDLFNISCGSHDEGGLFVRTHPSMFLKHGCNVQFAASIKKVVKKPVSCVGAIDDPELAEKIIASGDADIVEMARGLIADPYFPQKSYADRREDITPCLRCFVCIGESVSTKTIACTVNPVIGNEFDEKIPAPLPKKRRRILVAGGGPGGMEAAITAAARGHEVILCEAAAKLGGRLEYARYVSFKQDLYLFEQRMEERLRRSGTELRLNTRVTPKLVKELGPDALVIAIGADPLIPPIPGIDGPNVFQAVEVEKMPERFGKKIIILGGGLVGCETAVSLRAKGKEVTVIEMRGMVAADVNPFHRMALYQELEKIDVRTNTIGKRIEKGGLFCAGPDGREQFLPADGIVCAAGLRARTAEVLPLVNLTPEYFIVGDCKAPRQVTQAMSEGYYAMRAI